MLDRLSDTSANIWALLDLRTTNLYHKPEVRDQLLKHVIYYWVEPHLPLCLYKLARYAPRRLWSEKTLHNIQMESIV